jgi:AmmeMemoRadiSam system protein B
MVHHSSEGKMRRRKAAVAGSFYPGEASQLKRLLASVIDPDAAKTKALAVVSPHAGYIYSGGVAGAVFSSVELPDLFVILGPSHRPIRPLFAAMVEGVWETPLGSIPVEKTLAARILEGSKSIVADAAAHAGEHSLEVQLPFLQYLRPDLGIVPISVSSGASYPDLEDLGRSIAAGIKASGRRVLIVASTDMSHYVSREEARLPESASHSRGLQKAHGPNHLSSSTNTSPLLGCSPGREIAGRGRLAAACRCRARLNRTW